MAKKCGNCGAPAPDSNSRFCDLCGAPFKEEPVTPQGLPVCPACGATVSDIKAQFCDVCGAPLAKPVCPSCGNTAPSYHSKFCTRCGASFVPGVPGKGRKMPAAAIPAPAPLAVPEPEPEPVKIQLRKGRLPVQEDTSEEWDPWTDGDPTYDITQPLPPQPLQQQFTDPPAPMTEPVPTTPVQYSPAYQDPAVNQHRGKYSHIPLIADELKADLDRRASDIPEEKPGKKSRQGKKDGMFKFLK